MKHLIIGALALLPTVAVAKAPAAAPAMVSAADPRAAAAGLAMLKAGGNAMDAVAATAIALTVVEPQSSGIGGGGLLVYQPAGGKTPLTFDGRETAPKAATDRLFLKDDGTPQPRGQAIPGGKSVGVPGNIAMLKLAHDKYGKLPWAKLFEPAIALARGGYDVTPRLANAIAESARTLSRQKEAAALYLHADGSPKKAGEHIVNEELARTFEAVAKDGPAAFYTGANAAALVAAVDHAPTNPSTMTTADMAAYRAKERAPVCGRYRQYRICSMGPPSAGGIAVIAMLGQLQGFDLSKLGKDSPVAWHLFADSERLAFADRAAYGGDMDFVTVPVAGLIDPAYLKERAKLISATATFAHAAPGQPKGAPPRAAPKAVEIPSTSDMAVADTSGNVASMTSTVEGGFGSSLVAGGYVLNNELTDFDFAPELDGQKVANRVQGGKRPRSSMSPSIVYGPDGKVVLAVGAAGGPTIPAQVAKAIIGVLDWHLSIQEAIALPLVFTHDDTLVLEKGPMFAAMEPALKAMGHRTVQFSLGLKANGIERVPGGW
ncbi:MAG: gamma-glutamyltransferase, partial [Sphingomonadaceae bacterium]|nr:gamma-glutamyltransferase [Sphingomonadaceae bacterium]